MLKYVALGSQEELLVDVSDRTAGMTTITGGKHEVKKLADNSWQVGTGAYAGAVASTSSGLTIISSINTAGWAVGDYALYVWFQVAGNNVRKGPHYFSVVA